MNKQTFSIIFTIAMMTSMTQAGRYGKGKANNNSHSRYINKTSNESRNSHPIFSVVKSVDIPAGAKAHVEA